MLGLNVGGAARTAKTVHALVPIGPLCYQRCSACPFRGKRRLRSRPAAVIVRPKAILGSDSENIPLDQHPQLVSAISEATLAGPGPSPVGGLAAFLLLLTGYGVWRFATYGRLQFITAAMLGRWVPKGNARVIQVGGGSRDLYYYPKDTVLVTAISPKLNKGMMGQAGVQAGVPVEVRQETPKNLSFQGNNSVEAVVCLHSMHTLPNLPRFLSEVQRVLKPGCPFIFLQAVKGEGLASATQLILGGSGRALDNSALDALKGMPGFESVEWDLALAGQNPHAIGVAIKGSSDSKEREVEFVRRANKSNRDKRQSVKTGFGRS